MKTVFEPARQVPVAGEFDLCVVGGSCTGVFAAVRAARLGLKVALVEQNAILGGMATAAQVNEWHSLHGVDHSRQIIAGLTDEVLQRLQRRAALLKMPRKNRGHYRFNSAELAYVLDELAREGGIRVFFAARFAEAVFEVTPEGRRVTAALIEDKSGRRAVCARFFIDASGDGDLLRRAGFPARKSCSLQPVTLQALVSGLAPLLRSEHRHELWSLIQPSAAAHQYPVQNGVPWFMEYPGAPELMNVFGPRQNHVDGSNADEVSGALMEGRRQHQALLSMIRDAFSIHPQVVSWPHALGVRETWHACCQHQLTATQLLHGTPFPDAIANGTYPVDIHHSQGTFLRYLDGREEVIMANGSHRWGRWRDEAKSPECYHIPYRSLVPRGSINVLAAGRMHDADREAFAATRVMVNMNQTGEAAGVAAAVALRSSASAGEISVDALREELARGGSIVLRSRPAAMAAACSGA